MGKRAVQALFGEGSVGPGNFWQTTQHQADRKTVKSMAEKSLSISLLSHLFSSPYYHLPPHIIPPSLFPYLNISYAFLLHTHI